MSSWQTDDFRLVPLAAPIGDSFRNLRSLVFSNSCHGLHLQENSSIQPWAQESFFRCGRAYAPTEASGTFLWFDMFIHVFGIARSSYGSTTDWNLATSKIGESPLNQGSSVCFSFQDDKNWINYISEPRNIHGVIRLFPCIFTTRPWWIGACATYGESVTPSPDGSEASHFQGVVLFIVGCDLFLCLINNKILLFVSIITSFWILTWFRYYSIDLYCYMDTIFFCLPSAFCNQPILFSIKSPRRNVSILMVTLTWASRLLA